VSISVTIEACKAPTTVLAWHACSAKKSSCSTINSRRPAERLLSLSSGAPGVSSLHVRTTWTQTLTCDPAAAAPLRESLWSDPKALITRGRLLQAKDRCRVVQLDEPCGPLLLKEHNWGNIWQTLRKTFTVSKARRAFAQAFWLQSRQIVTPRPLALLERRTAGVLGSSMLITEYIPGQSLYHLLRNGRLDGERFRAVADQIAEACARLLRCSCAHNDLKPENLIVDARERVWLIDLENCRQYADRRDLAERFLKDVQRLLHARTWCGHPVEERQLRQRLAGQPEIATALALAAPRFDVLAQELASERAEEGRLSVLIAIGPDAPSLPSCWESVRDIADEILFVDAGADERSLDVVRQLHGRIVRAGGQNPLERCRQALAGATHPWVLLLLASERVSPDLALEIQWLLASDAPKACYRIELRPELRTWSASLRVHRSDRPVRLFRRAQGQFAAGEMPPAILTDREPGELNARIMVNVLQRHDVVPQVRRAG